MSCRGAGTRQFLAVLCNWGEGMTNVQKAPLKQASPEWETEGFQWEAPNWRKTHRIFSLFLPAAF